jgi:hypothetical protein
VQANTHPLTLSLTHRVQALGHTTWRAHGNALEWTRCPPENTPTVEARVPCPNTSQACSCTHAHSHSTLHSITLQERHAAHRASTANYCYCHTIQQKPEPCGTRRQQTTQTDTISYCTPTPPSCPLPPAESINSETNETPEVHPVAYRGSTPPGLQQ